MLSVDQIVILRTGAVINQWRCHETFCFWNWKIYLKKKKSEKVGYWNKKQPFKQYNDESKVLQYFSSTWSTIRQFRILLLRSWRWKTTLHCEMLSSPDTLRWQFDGFAAMAERSIASEFRQTDEIFAIRSKFLELSGSIINSAITLLTKLKKWKRKRKKKEMPN